MWHVHSSLQLHPLSSSLSFSLFRFLNIHFSRCRMTIPSTVATPTRTSRVLTHWAKATPEEGIQVIFSRSEILRAGPAGVNLITESPLPDRPCQWSINLRSAAIADPNLPNLKRTAAAARRTATSLVSNTPSTLTSEASHHLPCREPWSPLLLHLTIEPLIHARLNTGTGAYIEDPFSPSRVRCDEYRTLYIYSPKLQLDICAHPILRGSWPQTVVFDGEDVSESGSNGNTSVSSSGRTSGNSRSKQVDDDDSCLYFQIWLSGARSRHPPEDVGAKIRTSGAPRRPLDQCRELLRRLRADESTADVEITIRPTQSEFSHGSTRQNGEGDEFVLEETEESQDEDEEEIEEIHQTVLGKRTISEVEGDGSNSEQDEGNVEDQSDHPKLALPSITPANIATYPQRTRDRQRLQAHGSTTPAALSRENTMVDERDAEMISSSQQTVMDAQDLLTSCQKRPKTKKANRQTTTTSTKARPKDRSSYLLTTSGAPTRRRFLAHKCILESSPFFERMLSGHFREGQLDRHTLRHQVELSSDMFAEEIMDVLLDYMYTREPIQDSDSTPERVALDRNLEVEDRSIDRPETNSAEQEQEQEQGGEDVHYYVSANVGLNLQSTMTEARCRARDSLSALPRAEEVRDGRNALTLQQWGALYRASIHLEDTGLQMQALTKVQEKLDPETTLDQVVSWGHQHGPIKTVMMDYLVEKRRDVFGDEQRNKLRPYLWANDALQVEALVELTSQIARR